MVMNWEKEQREQSFGEKKKIYFSRLALSVFKAMRLHKTMGLWERNKEGKRDWGNVSEHCLVEVARTEIFAEKLLLSEETSRNLKIAAALHDADKKIEILAMKAALKRGESSGEASDAADVVGEHHMREAGFSDAVIELKNCVGGKPPKLFAIEKILGQALLADHEITLLVLHYIDGYTHDSDWAESVVELENGALLNEVDRRMQKNQENSTYRKINEESIPAFAGHPLLEGRGNIENEGIVCHEIENRLAQLITARSGEKINPLKLPEVIDWEIKKRIQEVAL